LDVNEIIVIVGKLLLSAVLGGAIGFERESHGQAAGLRTNILVSVGACLMMMLSLHMEELFRHLDAYSAVRLDPGRIASYAIASMGFLGAGAIIKGKGSVRGLTTAAGLWLVTGVGLAIGAGYIIPAVVSTMISLLILFGFRCFKTVVSRDMYTLLFMEFNGLSNRLNEIRDIFAQFPEFSIQSINYSQDFVRRKTIYNLRILSKELKKWEDLLTSLSGLNELEIIKWNESDVP
jgi:putative Mg2+ transporter-C (MgtC) family protein